MEDEDYELWEQIFEIPSIQAHMCLYRDYPVQAQSRYRHTFSVSKVCACNENLLYYWKTAGNPPHYKNVPVKKLRNLKNGK